MTKITLVHLDLGIGGAEQLVVSIACALKEMGHTVTIITSHHDHNHCFEETKIGGVLGDCIEVYGDWLPRHILGKCTAFCAIIRMIYLSVTLILKILVPRICLQSFEYFNGATKGFRDDELIFMDGVSASLPLFFFAGIPSIFYCHFPDKLLCTERGSIIKRMYRSAIDNLEEISTGCSSVIVVNSNFTAGVFRQSFQSLVKFRHLRPLVMYPTVKDQCEREEKNKKIIVTTDIMSDFIPYTDGYDNVFVSLNRYERKKNITLAIDAFHNLKQKCITEGRSVVLVIAGGYDVSVIENVEYLSELTAHCNSLSLPFTSTTNTASTTISTSTVNPILEAKILRFDVVFRTSIPGLERDALLARADALLYTPDREHFGIVPLEAMYAETPVVCVASGGPLETVLHGLSGFLCKQDPLEFAAAMESLMADTVSDGERARLLKALQGFKGVPGVDVVPPPSCTLSQLMGRIGKAHVQMNFTSSVMRDKLQESIETAMRNQKKDPSPYTMAIRTILPIVFLNILIFIAIFIGFSTKSES